MISISRSGRFSLYYSNVILLQQTSHLYQAELDVYRFYCASGYYDKMVDELKLTLPPCPD